MKLSVQDAGRVSYGAGYALQTELHGARVAEPEGADTLLLVEHDPVYTLGRNADRANVLFDAKDRELLGIGVEQTDRGGQVTYHGPGQIIGYPIIGLTQRGGRGVAWYVDRLEEVLIRTLDGFGIRSGRDAVNPGVWIGRDKVAAIGIRVRRAVTLHGFALNVAVRLDHYLGIVPCGIHGRGVTSMHIQQPEVTVAAVKPLLIAQFRAVFGYEQIDGDGKGQACD